MKVNISDLTWGRHSFTQEEGKARGQHNLRGQGYGVPRTLLTIPKNQEGFLLL